MVRHPAGETVTITRMGEVIPDEYDEQGNPVVAANTTFDIADVAVAPQGSTETADAPGIFVITGYDLYCPYSTPPLSPTDRFTIRGVTGWQMTGDSTVAGWRNPFNGRTPGVVVSVKRAS